MNRAGEEDQNLPTCPELQCTYPLCLPRAEIDADDLHRQHEDLIRRAPDIFAADETACSIELREYAQERPQQLGGRLEGGHDARMDAGTTLSPVTGAGRLSAPEAVSTIDGLQAVLQRRLPPGSIRVFSINRANSWSRMKITLNMFQMLCATSQATPRIVDLTRGMQSRTSPGDEHFMSCYCSVQGSSDQPTRNGNQVSQLRTVSRGLEVCYNLRHFERHGRNQKDPWSCRQSVFHHRHFLANSLSLWIVIQPSMRWKATLKDLKPDCIAHPLALHLRSLSSAVANNWEYLEHISGKLMSLDHSVAFPKPLAQFKLEFTTNQDVHALRRKLHHVKTILDGTQRTVTALSKFGVSIRESADIPTSAHDAFIRELDNISRDLAAHKSTVSELLNLSANITSTINSILDFRNQDMLRDNGTQLHRVAEDNARETLAMAALAKSTYIDSRSVRIATIIALIYLPANLVLAFFSTIFVDIQPPSGVTTGASSAGVGGGSQLLVYHQIWVMILSMVALGFGTGGGFWLWNCKRQPITIPSTC